MEGRMDSVDEVRKKIEFVTIGRVCQIRILRLVIPPTFAFPPSPPRLTFPSCLGSNQVKHDFDSGQLVSLGRKNLLLLKLESCSITRQNVLQLFLGQVQTRVCIQPLPSSHLAQIMLFSP